MTKKIILFNLIIIFVLIISLELIFNFFKLSGLMGIQKGLIYSKNDTFFLSPDSSGIVFDEKVFTDKYGFRVPYENYDYSRFENSNIIYEKLIEKLKLYESQQLGRKKVIHGDPVLTNILINQFGKIKLIDMRGKQGNKLTNLLHRFYL